MYPMLIFRTAFRKYSSIKFNENTFSGNRVIPSGSTKKKKYGHTDMTNAIVDFFSVLLMCLKVITV
jgi:hypothetical protein